MQTISTIGLGKLGAPLAACFAHKGYSVIGVDSNPRVVRMINEGVPPVFETGLDKLLAACRSRLVATDDYDRAIANSNVTFIVVPTPSDGDGGFSLQQVIPACERIGDALRNKPDFHLVVLTSTVLPGATEAQEKPVLEAHSHKQCGREFGLCYSPEFVALGSVIRDFLNPDLVLIGESDAASGQLLASIYLSVCDNAPPVARMNFVNAELTKLAVNSYVTTKITFANMLARLCERLPEANVDVVTAAL